MRNAIYTIFKFFMYFLFKNINSFFYDLSYTNCQFLRFVENTLRTKDITHLIFFYANIFNNLPFLWVQDYSPGMESGVVNYSSSIVILFQLHYVDGVESLVSPIEVAAHPVDSHSFHIAYSFVHHSLPL